MLWPRATVGRSVRRGDTLAVVTDFHGEAVGAIVSPPDGVLMYQAVTPPISAGETAAAIGIRLP
jgi:predicted deacylase